MAAGDDEANQTAARLGEAFHRARLDRGFTLADVGETIGTSPSWISRLEHGHGASAPMSTWYRLATTVGLDLDVAISSSSGAPDVLDGFRRRALDRLAEIASGGGWSSRTEIVVDPFRAVTSTMEIRRMDTRPDRRQLAVVPLWDMVGDVSTAVQALDAAIDARRAVLGSGWSVSGLIVVRRTTDARRRLGGAGELVSNRFYDSGSRWIATLRSPRLRMPPDTSMIWIDAEARRLIPMFLRLDRPRRTSAR